MNARSLFKVFSVAGAALVVQLPWPHAAALAPEVAALSATARLRSKSWVSSI